ncbi:Linear gramicidin dehydrogenase LgrE [Streptomyces sp. YIM 130001]|uniref:thioesterase II family protein n=1 Tax=Streptomyces sp. YIM 130001 TaxID=2259644 RepID=UPI000E64760A|nr:thioesterase domain-containing protein [Streptomyces sp. YIM 130001]RII13497.1 Linear gramicidin dehydrogenase LgrE [Streptomyces sp. YIM 130001]
MADDRPVRLHCFAHSGGASPFQNWTVDVGPGVVPVPVLLPGGERRPGEPRVTTHEALIADLLPHFTDVGREPYVLYGHGLGAMVALCVTRALHEAGLPGPALLAVAAWPPPPAPADLPDTRGATDDELLQRLSSRGGVPLTSDEGVWLRAALPVIRADMELAESLHAALGRPSPAGPLRTPLLVISSQENPLARDSATGDWQAWTQGPIHSRTVPGRHFFSGSHELPRLLGRACRVVRRVEAQPVPVG